MRIRAAYTIFEVIVVIIILGVMASLAIPRFTTQMYRMRNGEADRILLAIYSSQLEFEQDTGGFATAIGQLDISLDSSPKNFADPTVNNLDDVSCGGPARQYVASMQANQGGYILYVLDDASIVCTDDTGACPATICSKLGFPSF